MQRPLLYEITGDGLASTLFRLDVNNGLITLAQCLRSDNADSYVVSDVTVSADSYVVTSRSRLYAVSNVTLPTLMWKSNQTANSSVISVVTLQTMCVTAYSYVVNDVTANS